MSGFEELGVSWGLGWLLLAGAWCRGGVFRPCAGMGFRRRRRVVLSAPPSRLKARGRPGPRRLRPVVVRWWSPGDAVLLVGSVAPARDGDGAPVVLAVSCGLGWLQIDALDELGYRGYGSRQGRVLAYWGYASRQGIVLGSKPPGRLGVSELDQ